VTGGVESRERARGEAPEARLAGTRVQLVGVLVLVAFAVAVAGGYGLGWTWTGFADNDTAWEWLHLLVLPVVVAAIPFWYATRERLRIEWRALCAAVVLAFAALVAGGYGLDWRFTGFHGRTLWDWLELLVLPLVVALLPIWLATRTSRHPRWRLAFALLALAFVVLVIGGYGLDWTWTGFSDNTLWDWLQLLLVPFALPAALTWIALRLEATPSSEPVAEAPAPRSAGAG
jgi:heme/copper-type cytochrome/quinol oxidase subunit 4